MNSKVEELSNLEWFFDEVDKKRINYPYDFIHMMEVLNAYWLTEPDEEQVKVLMKFKHHDGQEQMKEFVWNNPKYAKAEDSAALHGMTALEILNQPIRCEWCGHVTRPLDNKFDVNENPVDNSDFRLILAPTGAQDALEKALNGGRIIGATTINGAPDGLVRSEAVLIYFEKDHKRYCMKLLTTDSATKMTATLAELKDDSRAGNNLI